MQMLEIKESDKILIIAPHPDDECIGPGGILSRYAKICTVIVLTDGRQSQGKVAPEIEKEVRKQEFLNEMRELDVEYYRMLDYEDGTLMQHIDCLEKMDLSLYTKIFVTGCQDDHPDHTAACLSVYHALDKQCIKDIELYFYEVHTLLQRPTHVLDITDVMERKEQLIRFHASQLKTLHYDELARCMAQYRGLQNRLQGYYEVYENVPIDVMPEDHSIELEKKIQKQILFYWVFVRWLDLRIKGHSIADLLRKNGFYKIAIYGYAEMGRLLCEEVMSGGLEVAYILDKKLAGTVSQKIPICKPEKGLPKVDAIIVTAVYYFHEIRDELQQKGFDNIISLKNLLEGEL